MSATTGGGTTDAAARGALTVLIAPDSFKGSLAATEVAADIVAGWADVRPQDRIVALPQADGGEGTLDAVEAATPHSVRRDAGMVTGPDGRPVPGQWLELPGGVAIVELAQCSGIPLMESLDPLGGQTVGLGEVIGSALAWGARSLVVGLGGSASTDGGAGALAALGHDLLDAAGERLPPGGAALARLVRVDSRRAAAPPPGGVTLLTDVEAPLLGAAGAAAVFGPQKGASPAQVAQLDAALATFARVLGGDPSQPGAGAAGGTGYGLATGLGATTVPGADHIAALTGLDDWLDGADILVTGEGRFDLTSLAGKVVGRLIDKADRRGLRLAVVAGQVSAAPTAASGSAIPAWSLVDIAGSVESAMREPRAALREAGRRAALALGGG